MISSTARHLGSNGPEFVAEAVRKWIGAVGAKTAYIEPGSPWENGYIESFNARFRPSRRRFACLPGNGRTAQRRNLLFPEGGPDHHRAMATPLQYQASAQRPRIQAASTQNHHPVARKTRHELTFKPDQSGGAGQAQMQRLLPDDLDQGEA